MARIKRGLTTRRRHKAVLRRAEGFRGTRNRLFKRAHEAVIHQELSRAGLGGSFGIAAGSAATATCSVARPETTH